MQTDDLLMAIKDAVVSPGKLRFWWLGQMGWCLKTASRTIYIDPYLTSREKRVYPPVLDPEKIDNADIILCTHDHIDHIDHPALPKIMDSSPAAILVVPDVAVTRLVTEDGVSVERIIASQAERVLEIDGCRITAIKAAHEDFDYTEENGYPYLQYIIELDGLVLYHTGDTLRYEGMLPKLKEWNIDVAFVPINGRDSIRYRRNCMGCMTWQEAADLCSELRPRLVCPGHWEMFPDNSENPYLFLDYCKVKYPYLNCWISLPGAGGEI